MMLLLEFRHGMSWNSYHQTLLNSWVTGTLFEPAHEIMALFILPKLILQTFMNNHPVGLDVYFHASCVRTAKALARLHRCAGSSEPSLVAYVISPIISWAGSFHDVFWDKAMFSIETMSTYKAINSKLKWSCDKQTVSLVVILYKMYKTCRRLI